MKLEPLNIFNKFFDCLKHFFVCFFKTKLSIGVIIFVCTVSILLPITVEFNLLRIVKNVFQINSGFLVTCDTVLHFNGSKQSSLSFKDMHELSKGSYKLIDWLPDSIPLLESVCEAATQPSNKNSATETKQPNVSSGKDDSENIHIVLLSQLPMYLAAILTPLFCYLAQRRNHRERSDPVERRVIRQEDYA